MSARGRALRDAALLGGLALLLRLGAQGHAAVLERDALGYLETARAWERGAWGEALAHTYPPAYPAALALLTAPLGGVEEGSALLASALLASLLAPLAFALAAGTAGARAARYAGLLAAILPLLVDRGAEISADAPFAALLLGGLLAATRAREAPRVAPLSCAAAALLGGLGYLARPEGIVALAALLGGLLALPRASGAGGARRRTLEAGCLLGLAALVVVPFLLAIKPHGVPDGRLAGEWKLTLKRDLAERLGELSLGLALERLRFMSWATLVALAPALPFLLAATRARWPLPARRLLPLALGTVGALLLAALLVREDRRYAATYATLLLGVPALGAAWLEGRLRGRVGRPGLALALALALPCVPVALRPRHQAHATFRDAGVLLGRAGAQRVLAYDSRVAYYAGAELVSLWAQLPGPGREQFLDPDALLRAVQASRPDAVVLEVETPAQAAAAAGLAQRLGVTLHPVRREGAEPLDVLLLGEPPR